MQRAQEIDILWTVAEHRVLTIPQITALLFSSKPVARRRIRQLCKSGLLSVEVTGDSGQQIDDITRILNPAGSSVRLGILYDRIEALLAKSAARSPSAVDHPRSKKSDTECVRALRPESSAITCGEQPESRSSPSSSERKLSPRAIGDTRGDSDVGEDSTGRSVNAGRRKAPRHPEW